MKRPPRKPLFAALVAMISTQAYAVGVGTDAQLAPVVVTGAGTHAPLAADIPSSTESKTAEELRAQNLFNPEDALRYVPNTTIRKRYSGDRNALIGGRDFGPLQPSRALVYVDGYLISNFLGRFDAPRWNMVTPEAIERVDVLYGPFSALFPGNSIGTTVMVTERKPAKTEAGARLTGYSQRFDLYGDSDDYNGGQLSAHLGGRMATGPWGALSFNHQDAHGHPMSYANATSTSTGAATAVTGTRYDTDPKGASRAIFGATTIDHTVQDTLKLRLGHAFTPTLEGDALIGLWNNDSTVSTRTFLRDAGGNEVWSGKVTDGVNIYNIAATAFAPSEREEEHHQFGATLKTKHDTGWNGSVVASLYEIANDEDHVASNPPPVAASGGGGTVTHRDGTGWNTLEFQALYRPVAGDFGDGRHTLTFGLHRNAYNLKSIVNNATDWRNTETTLNQRYVGDTEVYAVYAQDAWQLDDDLKLTAGLRAERFRAYDGELYNARVSSCTAASGVTCVSNGDGTFQQTTTYGSRAIDGASPKLSLSWAATDDLLLKASYGRGLRFPNVEELYNGTVTATTDNRSDPNLKAERADDIELSAEKLWEKQSLRAALFHNDVKDAILRQSNTTVTPTVINVSNVDRVRTYGIELVWKVDEVAGVRGLSLDANAALTSSKVVENDLDPGTEGKYWLRVPKTRGNLLLAWRPDERWMASLGWRHQGRAYNDPYNADINPDVYGGVSRVNEADLRVSYKPQPKLEFALGVDNVTDERSFQAHPYPGRTLFAEVRAAL